jgi:hypothetical protein
MQLRLLKVAGLAVLVWISVIFGVAAHKFQLPPYSFLASTYNYILPKEPEEFPDNDVAELISINNHEDINRLRTELITLLWEEPALPSSMPSSVATNISDKRFNDIRSFKRIDKLTVLMEFGIESYIYHFIPKSPNNKLVIYHEGHEGDFYNGKNHIQKFLDRGYSVVGMSMPLSGRNNHPVIDLPRLGRLKLERHDHLKFLTPEKGHPIKLFIEPVVVVLNYMDAKYNYSSISMLGISGGGWTTNMASAIDERVQKSFSIAGSYPIHLRSSEKDEWGDYEQTEAKIYQTASYLDLYILGSYGKHREQLQILNQYDPCCFAGTKSNTYKDIVKQRVTSLGAGQYDVFLDTTHRRHAISDASMNRILDRLGDNN